MRNFCQLFSAIFNENVEIRERCKVELQLPMSFPWPIFPGLDQDLFPPHGFPRFLGFDSKAVQRSALCRSRRELSNEYLLAKIGVDTAENEPCKVCPLSAYRSPRFADYRKNQEQTRQRIVSEREKKEVAECTFKPNTSACRSDC